MKVSAQLCAVLLLDPLLKGLGLFNPVVGTIRHQILGIHHVNETVVCEHWSYWDLGFLAWGAAMWIEAGYCLRLDAGTRTIFRECSRHTRSSAFTRSASRSSRCSRPTDRRTRPSEIPISARSSGAKR